MYNDEQWKFSRYHSINEVWVEGKRVARDAVLLESPGKLSAQERTLQDRQGVYSCYATAILCGPQVQQGVASLSAAFQSNSIFRTNEPEDLVWSTAQIPSGCVLRVAGKTTEVVKEWLRERLRFLENVIGLDAYSKAFV
jgi:urease accessory protein